MTEEARKPTKTQEDQWMVEAQVRRIYQHFYSIPHNSQSVLLELQRDNHIEYLTRGLRELGPSFVVLDANRPWLCYWILHSIALLGDHLDAKLKRNTIEFLKRCQDLGGGYGGGPGQMPHLATTYAAVNSLITLGGKKSLSSINREKIYSFLLRMKDESGGFRMHDGGEIDVRACYTAISVACLLKILDNKLTENLGNYIISCQSYEGGIAGEPGSEAHGGYTFCGMATMILIGEVNRLNLPSLIDWLVFRQGVEGGFQGRTNKLVDGCYSFWQGGMAALIQRLRTIVHWQMALLNDDCDSCTEGDSGSVMSDSTEGEQCCDETSSNANQSHLRHEVEGHRYDAAYEFISRQVTMRPLFNSICLQQYILLCSQVEGGFRDKPGKSRDYYHTCYCLSGLSVSQFCQSEDADSPPLPRDVLGPYSNLLEPVHPLFGIVLERYHEAREFFSCPRSI